MNIVRRRLALKLFLSYFIVILIGVIVLATAAELAVPRSFERHMSAMGSEMSGMMGDSTSDMDLNADLFSNFRLAVNEALIFATVASFFAAVLVSIFVSRRIVSPIREMKGASQHISLGNYQERVQVPGSLNPDEMDELAELGVSFNQMAEKLEQTESIRRQLIGDVAHEMRTPLSTIKGSIEGLLDGVLSAEPANYQQIQREVDRLQRLVFDLQELSRVEAKAFELNLNPVPMKQIVETVVSRLGGQFAEKGVDLQTGSSATDMPNVLVDEDRLEQVLLNLVGNALQYTPHGGSVQINLQRENDEVRVIISDTGIGILAEHLPHIFSRFYRVDPSRARVGGGSGIGLTISKHLVEAHGGRIWAESPGLDQGSTFIFTLPIIEATSSRL
jgi:histidine kinase